MTIRARALKIIADRLGLNESDILPPDGLEEIADSLDQMEIVIDLENEFLIEISDADIDAADTVGKLLDLVERLAVRAF